MYVSAFFGAAFTSWDVPLLAVVPDEPYLARPALIDLEKIFKTELLAGLKHRREPHYSIKHTLMAATGTYRVVCDHIAVHQLLADG